MPQLLGWCGGSWSKIFTVRPIWLSSIQPSSVLLCSALLSSWQASEFWASSNLPLFALSSAGISVSVIPIWDSRSLPICFNSSKVSLTFPSSSYPSFQCLCPMSLLIFKLFLHILHPHCRFLPLLPSPPPVFPPTPFPQIHSLDSPQKRAGLQGHHTNIA